MSQPLASLSLDLDNKWSYMKTHGDAGWDQFPSYLDLVVPRVLSMLEERGLKITFFIVGQDAALDQNHAALRSIADAGHEIGNHSFHHEPWLHLYSDSQLAEEFDRAEQAIFSATGQRQIGFRGPGYSFSREVHQELVRRGYAYDASTFPTFVGPLARAYYFFTARLTREEREDRKKLFGSWKEGFRPLKPYFLNGLDGPLLEIPVTTMPVFRAPIHLSYLLYLAGYSQALAKTYLRFALTMCRLRGVAPSFLLHPLDFLGGDDEPDLAFFPAMHQPGKTKCAFAGWALDLLAARFEIVPMREHARRLGASPPEAAERTLAGVG
ncbi:MAG: polysaccharide deacetylase family protein [Planctomycetales bacterium]|nr:polysaccharide deacetylase family protein [Planctomycetales bacterium]